MPDTKHRVPNRLIHEKSPYLLQHAHNPVDWYPWGEEAFAKALSEDKPIFLSIGYSTCHWCHVMERESFEDTEIAELLNQYFVSVKVDREERPDIDHIYMSVCQALTGQGGWPLTIFMTPEKNPFFAGTYFPKTAKWRRAGLLELLEEIRLKWVSDRDGLVDAGQRISEAVSRQYDDTSGKLKEQVIDNIYNFLSDHFDNDYGGFGKAPKFPTPHKLMFLLRYWKRSKDHKSLEIVEKTLKSMYAGGIYDHIGYGVSRYSTDHYWLVPHFEKMLYDNALVSLVLIEAYQATGKNFYLRAAEEIYEYILRDMTSPQGAFYSAEDADSEGVEGKYYVWDPKEVEKVLGSEDGKFFCELYNITDQGNFEGLSIPNLISSGVSDEVSPKVKEFVKKLFLYREKRVRPYKDDKVLTSWNGMMAASFARAAGATGNSKYLEAAKNAVDFIWHCLRRKDGRLLARYRDSQAAILGYLDDYAFLQWGLLELYGATLEPEYLNKAIQLLDGMKELFWDSDKGGFYFYGKDAEKLLDRPKEVYDGAVPSGNSVAANNIIRLARITGREDLLNLFRQQISAFAGIASEHPSGYVHFIASFLTYTASPREIVITGKEESSEVKAMVNAVQRSFLPETVLLFRPDTEKAADIEELSALAKGRVPVDGMPAAYICENFSCRQPITEVEELISKIKEM